MSCIKSEHHLSRNAYDRLVHRIQRLRHDEDLPCSTHLRCLEDNALDEYGIETVELQTDDLISDKYTIAGGLKNAKIYTKNIWKAIDELLQENQPEDLTWHYTPFVNEKGARYQEIAETGWMKEQQDDLGPEAKILIVIPASDETQITGGGKNAWPMYISNGNVDVATRQGKKHKRLIGFLPAVVAKGKKNADHPSVKTARLTIHNRWVNANSSKLH
jgi:hypothetical protein